MATYYLINLVRIGLTAILPGTLVDDTVADVTGITALGGVLVASSDARVAAAALVVGNARVNKGASEAEMEAVMRSALEASQQATAATSTAAIAANTASLVAIKTAVDTQADWYRSTATGDDANDGTLARPVKTWREVYTRLRGKTLRPVGNALVFHNLDDAPSTDPFMLDSVMGLGAHASLVGLPSLVRAGTLTGFSAIDITYATGAQATITDTGVASWASDLYSTGRYVLITSGAGTTRFWVDTNVGSGVAKISAPITPAPAPGTVTGASTYQVLQLPTISLGYVSLRTENGGQQAQTAFVVQDLKFTDVGGYSAINSDVQLSFIHCAFLTTTVTLKAERSEFLTIVLNCATVSDLAVANAQVYGGLFAGGAYVTTGGWGVFDIDCVVHGYGFWTSEMSFVQIGRVGIFGSSGSGLQIPNGAVVRLAPVTGTAALYGQSNTRYGVMVRANALLEYTGAASIISIKGSVNDANIGELTTVPLINASTGAVGAATAFTWAVLGSTFTNAVVNPARNARICQRAVSS